MKTKKILIIHRNEGVLREVHDILSHFDMELYYAKDGLHGVYAASSLKPDLIVTAIDIAILNGFDLVRMIRRSKAELPVIFLHDITDLQSINTAKQLRAAAFLTHPYLNNRLIYAIKRVLHLNRISILENPPPFEECRVRQLVKIDCA